MKSKKSNNQEMHPQFPSGEWEGFYTYQTNSMGEKFQMNFRLDFSQGVISGNGSDSIGGFGWKGTYDIEAMRAEMVKSYVTHDVRYNGHVDENGIWGTWIIPYSMAGGFHIWPKKKEESATQKEVVVKKKKNKKKKSFVKTL